MARVFVAPSATIDVFGFLADLTAKAGLRTAVKYDGMFQRHYSRLIDHPASGAPRPALGPDIRIGIVSSSTGMWRIAAR